MKSLTNVTHLKQFLGLCAYFRDYVPNMSDHTFLLRQLPKKGSPFKWTQDHEHSFENLKHLITDPSVMFHHPNWNASFQVHVDASKHGCGAMLAQEIEGKLHPIGFASRAFNAVESRWTTLQQELSAVKWGLEQFRPYIFGRRIKVMTDHANLQWLTTIAPQQAKVARWCMSMAEFDFYIEHRSGATDVVPDVLSRYQAVTKVPDCSLVTLPDHKIESFFLLALSVDVPTHTTQEVTDTLSPAVIYMSIACLLTHPTCTSPTSARGHGSNTDTAMEKPQVNLTDDKPTCSNSNTLPTLDPTELKRLNPQRAAFAELQQNDYWCKNLIKYLSSGQKKVSIAHLPTKRQQWVKQMSNRTVVKDDLLMYRDEFMVNPSQYRIMVPNDIELRRKLLQAYHDSPLAMHRGRDTTYESLSYDYYWKGMAKQAKNWIQRCPQCIRFKTPVPNYGPMQVRLYQSPLYVPLA